MAIVTVRRNTRRHLALLVLVLIMAVPAEASAYSCSGRCYGSTAWNGLVDGSNVRISVASTYMNDGSRFINNGMWLLDVGGNTCTISSGHPSSVTWAEVHMTARQGRYRYMWADCRPGMIYRDVILADVPAADYGTQPLFEIARTAATTFRISIQSGNYSMTHYSLSNTMAPDRIRIGQELNGTTGGHAHDLKWTHNRYIHGGTAYFQFRPGDGTTIEAPVQAWWHTVPAPGNNGGDWRARCPCGP